MFYENEKSHVNRFQGSLRVQIRQQVEDLIANINGIVI